MGSLVDPMSHDMTEASDDSVTERMLADVQVAFHLFGAAATSPLLLAEALRGHTDACDTWAADEEWANRAARLIAEARHGDSSAIARCADRAFDDTDARLRGVAWCVLAHMLDDGARGESARAILHDVLKRFAAKADPRSRDFYPHYFSYFSEMLSAEFACGSGLQELMAMEQAYIEAHAGADAAAMQSSLSAALAFLAHPDSACRLAALRATVRAGRHDPDAAGAVRAVMLGDLDADVRVAAIVAYTDLHQGSSDEECLRVLAELVLDDQPPLIERYAAYCGLFCVCTDRLGDSPSGKHDAREFARLREGAPGAGWPIKIDWGFVRECARGRG